MKHKKITSKSVRKKKQDCALQEDDERFLPWMEDPIINYEHLHRYRFAQELVKGKKVLDLACGEGYGSYMLAEKAREVIGVDINESTIKHASVKYIKDNLKFIKGSMTEITIEGKKIFDVIICFEALEHIEEHNKLITEARRLLKDNGLFIVSTPDKYIYSDQANYRNPWHKKELYLDEFKALLKSAFKNVLIYGQRVFPTSNIFPLFKDSITTTEYIIEKRGKTFLFTQPERKKALYYIAISSNAHIDVIGSSYLLDVSETFQIALREKETTLNRIYESTGWKVLLIYYRLRDRILGINTRIEKEPKCEKIFQNDELIQDFMEDIDKPPFLSDKIRDFIKRIAKKLLPKKIQIYIKLAIFAFLSRDKNKKYNRMVNTKKPFISIVIPIYNHAIFLRQAIESALNQNYDNYEIVAIDDFSTDPQVRKVLDEFSKKCKKLRVFYNKTNAGISETLNRAIINAKGDYITFLDCDDFIPHYAIKRAAAAISENNDKRYFYSNRINVDTNGKEVERVLFINRKQNDYLRELMRGMFTDHLKIIRKDCFSEVGLLDERYDFVQDYEFALRFAFIYPTGFAYINDYLYFHRVYPEQISSKKSESQKTLAENARDAIKFKINIKKGQNDKKVSIIILSFHKKEHTIRCIKSIKGTVRGDYEIILFDNGSGEDTVGLLHKNFSNDNKVKMFFSSDNLGCAGGRKKAISYAGGNYIITLDNDIVVTQGWIEELILRVEEDTNISGACCKVIFPDNTIQYNGGKAIMRDGFVEFFLIDTRKGADDVTTMRKYNCDWIPGGATIYKREIYEKVSIHEEFAGGYEDNDFSWTVKNLGYRIVNCPTARVIHNHLYYDKKSAIFENEYIDRRYNREAIKQSVIAFYKRHGLIIKNELLKVHDLALLPEKS